MLTLLKYFKNAGHAVIWVTDERLHGILTNEPLLLTSGVQLSIKIKIFEFLNLDNSKSP